jgi:predicted restriction endonuclease
VKKKVLKSIFMSGKQALEYQPNFLAGTVDMYHAHQFFTTTGDISASNKQTFISLNSPFVYFLRFL